MPDTAKWINTMLDRIGLLTPRLIEIGGDTSTPLLEILRDTRVGISLDELQRLGSGLVDHSQKMTVAARAIAEKKAVGQRS